MSTHVFVDESKERGYVVAAAVVRSAEVAASRQAMRNLIMPRQRRIHFTNESNARRNKILDTIVEMGVRVRIYDAGRQPNPKRGRDACLLRLVADLPEVKAQRLVLEREDAAFKTDQALLYAELRTHGLAHVLRYDHLRAHEEGLLAIPDAVAWCWARGGTWRARAQELISEVRRV